MHLWRRLPPYFLQHLFLRCLQCFKSRCHRLFIRDTHSTEQWQDPNQIIALHHKSWQLVVITKVDDRFDQVFRLFRCGRLFLAWLPLFRLLGEAHGVVELVQGHVHLLLSEMTLQQFDLAAALFSH